MECKIWGERELSIFYAHRHLVHEAAAHYPNVYRDHTDEVYSFGFYGLWRAIEEYDDSKGASFYSWAKWKIKWAIKDGLRELDLISRNSRDSLKKLTLVSNELAQKFGASPTWTQLAEHGVDVAGAVRAAQFAHQSEPEFSYWLDKQTVTGPEVVVIAHDVELRMGKFIARLPEQMKIVIELMYYGEYSQKEVSEVLGVSDSRICQIHKQALRLLKDMIGDEFTR